MLEKEMPKEGVTFCASRRKVVEERDRVAIVSPKVFVLKRIERRDERRGEIWGSGD